ncbi:MAG: HlyD family efflux transporter periplasmic adaptor subunit [Fuerstiella sp.]
MSHSWIEEFEQRLQQLEQSAAITESDVNQATDRAAAAVACLGEDSIAEFWIAQPEAIYRVADGHLKPLSPAQSDQLRQLEGRSIHWVARSELTLNWGHQSPNDPDVLLCRYPLAKSQEFIVAVSCVRFYGSRPEAEQATLAVTTIVASQVAQHLLSKATESTDMIAALLDFATRLQHCDDEDSVRQVVAQESGIIWSQCRIATLEFGSTKHQVTSMTGAGQVNRQSSQIQAIASLADFLLPQETQHETNQASLQADPNDQQQIIKWYSRDHLEETAPRAKPQTELLQLLDDYRTLGIEHVGFAKIQCNQVHVATVLLESQETQPQSSSTANSFVATQWLQLIAAATTRTHRSSKQLTAWPLRSWPAFIGMTCLLVAISFLIPMDFELTATGQLVARGRRSIFAPESGTVTKVHFQNEQRVNRQAPLVTLANPELVQRASELDGEIATTQAAEAAANARRTSRTAEGSAAEGQVLKQRLKSLRAERNLFEQRIASLQILAPFQGYVVRRDAEHDLTDRPLQRGQRIAELIPLNDDWELELHIPQSHSAYLNTALSRHETGLPLRFIINSDSNFTHSATLRAFEKFTYVRNSKLVQNAPVAVQLADTSNAKSGTSVSARISCGRSTLGFVATRKLIETLQHLKFVWWN